MNKLDPKAVWLFFFSTVLRWSFFVLFFGIWLSFTIGEILNETGEFSLTFLNWFWIIIPLFLVFSFIWSKLTYNFYKYELTDKGFTKELGVIYKKYVTIPYDRIQNVDIYRGILARILGLSDINIQTAGASATVNRYGAFGMGAEGRLPAVSKETAEKLRDELIERTQKKTDQGL